MSAATLYREDELIVRSGECTQEMAETQAEYRRALGLGTGTGHRHWHGDRGSLAAHAILAVHRAAGAEGVNHWSLVAEVIAVAIEEDGMLSQPTAQLLDRLLELDDREHLLEAAENRATARGDDLRAAARANLRECRVQLERAAILFTLDFRSRRGRQQRLA